MNRTFLIQTIMLCGSCIFSSCGGPSKNPYPKHSKEETISPDQHDLQADILTVEFHCLYPQKSLEWTGAIPCPFKRIIKDRELQANTNQSPSPPKTFQVVKFPLQASVLQLQKQSHGESMHLQNVLSLPYSSLEETEAEWAVLKCCDQQGTLLERIEIERWDGSLLCDVSMGG